MIEEKIADSRLATPRVGIARSQHRLVVWVAACVSVVTFLAYLPTLQNGFVQWDDPSYVFRNPYIRTLHGDFFRWSFLDFHASNWHPLTWLSHALDYALWGLNPFGHHLSNNIIHSLNSFIVVLLAFRLLYVYSRIKHPEGGNNPSRDVSFLIASAATGLLFGLHPIHVESVAWVSERKDVLCALFFLFSIFAYTGAVLDARERAGTRLSVRNKQYLLSLLFFILALLSKPMAVSLPLVLLLLDWHPFERIYSFKSLQARLVEKIPFFGLSLGSSVITILAQRAGGAMSDIRSLPLSDRLLVASKSVIDYLGNMLLPLNLVPYYPYPQNASLASPRYLLSIFLVAALTAVSVRMAARNRLWLAGWSYYLVTLLPVAGLVQVGGQAMADRYMYLPSLGPFLIAGLAAAWCWKKIAGMHGRAFWVFSSAIVAGMVLLAAAVFLTIDQIKIWKNNFMLWNQVVEKQSIAVPFVYSNRGLAWMEQGGIGQAIEDFNTAILLDPKDYKLYANRGLAYAETGRTDKALRDFSTALSLNPVFFEAYNNRGMVYGRNGLFREAIAEFDNSIRISPNPLAFCNRGLAYFLTGQYELALRDFNSALGMDDRYAQVYGSRGNLYLKVGNMALARSDFERACGLGDQQACSVMRNLP